VAERLQAGTMPFAGSQPAEINRKVGKLEAAKTELDTVQSHNPLLER
jgi:hypothetical protein